MTTPTQKDLDRWATSHVEVRYKQGEFIIEEYPAIGLRVKLEPNGSALKVVGIEALYSSEHVDKNSNKRVKSKLSDQEIEKMVGLI